MAGPHERRGGSGRRGRPAPSRRRSEAEKKAAESAAMSHEELQAELDRTRAEKEELAAKLAESPEAKAERRAKRLAHGDRDRAHRDRMSSGGRSRYRPSGWTGRSWTRTRGSTRWRRSRRTPSVQNYVADTATNALFEQVNVQQLAEQALPPKLVPFAPAIAGRGARLRERPGALVHAQPAVLPGLGRDEPHRPQGDRDGADARVRRGALLERRQGDPGHRHARGLDQGQARRARGWASSPTSRPRRSRAGRSCSSSRRTWRRRRRVIVGMGFAAILLPLLALAVPRRRASPWRWTGARRSCGRASASWSRCSCRSRASTWGRPCS